jgi:uncharacterized protein
LRGFLAHPVFLGIEHITNNIPSACAPCRWRDVCRGGDIENRYSTAKEFDNPSVYCDAYQSFYEKVCALLVDNGYPVELITEKFAA